MRCRDDKGFAGYMTEIGDRAASARFKWLKKLDADGAMEELLMIQSALDAAYIYLAGKRKGEDDGS